MLASVCLASFVSAGQSTGTLGRAEPLTRLPLLAFARVCGNVVAGPIVTSGPNVAGVCGNVVTMSSGTAEVWVCDYPGCGHVWLVGACIPQRCAKCHRRGWNSKRVVGVETPAVAQVTEPKPAPKAKAARPDEPKPDYLSMKPSDGLRLRRERNARGLA